MVTQAEINRHWGPKTDTTAEVLNVDAVVIPDTGFVLDNTTLEEDGHSLKPQGPLGLTSETVKSYIKDKVADAVDDTVDATKEVGADVQRAGKDLGKGDIKQAVGQLGETGLDAVGSAAEIVAQDVAGGKEANAALEESGTFDALQKAEEKSKIAQAVIETALNPVEDATAVVADTMEAAEAVSNVNVDKARDELGLKTTAEDIREDPDVRKDFNEEITGVVGAELGAKVGGANMSTMADMAAVATTAEDEEADEQRFEEAWAKYSSVGDVRYDKATFKQLYVGDDRDRLDLIIAGGRPDGPAPRDNKVLADVAQTYNYTFKTNTPQCSASGGRRLSAGPGDQCRAPSSQPADPAKMALNEQQRQQQRQHNKKVRFASRGPTYGPVGLDYDAVTFGDRDYGWERASGVKRVDGGKADVRPPEAIGYIVYPVAHAHLYEGHVVSF